MVFSSLDKTIADDHFAVKGSRGFCRAAAPPGVRFVGSALWMRLDPRRGVGSELLADARTTIGASAARRLRPRAWRTVKLVAVSKTFSADEVWPTIAVAGQTRFGENRVQEAIPKWRDLRARAAALGRSDRTSPDRAPAKQQGARGDRDLRRHRNRRPGENRRGAGARNRAGRQAPAPVRRGQHRRANRRRRASFPRTPTPSSRSAATPTD